MCSLGEARSLLRYYHVHGNVIRLGMNCYKRLLSITHAKLEWRVFHHCERSVEKTTSIAEPITSPVEADHGHYHHVRHYFLEGYRHWNVPDAPRERLSWTPGPALATARFSTEGASIAASLAQGRLLPSFSAAAFSLCGAVPGAALAIAGAYRVPSVPFGLVSRVLAPLRAANRLMRKARCFAFNGDDRPHRAWRESRVQDCAYLQTATPPTRTHQQPQPPQPPHLQPPQLARKGS